MNPKQISDLRLHADDQKRRLHANLDKLRHVSKTPLVSSNVRALHERMKALLDNSTGSSSPQK